MPRRFWTKTQWSCYDVNVLHKANKYLYDSTLHPNGAEYPYCRNCMAQHSGASTQPQPPPPQPQHDRNRALIELERFAEQGVQTNARRGVTQLFELSVAHRPCWRGPPYVSFDFARYRYRVCALRGLPGVFRPMRDWSTPFGGFSRWWHSGTTREIVDVRVGQYHTNIEAMPLGSDGWFVIWSVAIGWTGHCLVHLERAGRRVELATSVLPYIRLILAYCGFTYPWDNP